ncbi:MAG: DUF6134 family protein [Pseudomonadota bacterium]
MKQLFGFAISFMVATATPAFAKDAAFDIFRKGEKIGSHKVSVNAVGDETIAETEIDMRVGFGPITLYRYKHRSREVWRDGAVYSIESSTNDNGEKMNLSALREEGVLQIDGSGYQGEAPLGTVPSSYWNKEILKARYLLNTQNGEIIDVEINKIGKTDALMASGDKFAADEYKLNGTVDLQLWYIDHNWTGAEFTVGGERLVYGYAGGAVDATQYAALSSE